MWRRAGRRRRQPRQRRRSSFRPMGLTQAQVLFFVEHGYLILPGFMDATLCAAARDVLWRGNRSCRLDRADPSTWVGPFAPADETSDPAQLFVNGRRGFRWHYGECGGEPAVMDALPRAVLPLVDGRRPWVGRVK